MVVWMSDYIVEIMPNKTENEENCFRILQKSTGWFYPNLSKIMAEQLCEKLNENIFFDDMLGEVSKLVDKGYKVKQICVKGDVFSEGEIVDIGFRTNYVCIKLIYEEILFVDLDNINWISVVEE